MWEWSNRLIKKKTSEKNKNSVSLLAAYDDILGREFSAYRERIKDIEIAETPADHNILTIEAKEMRNIITRRVAEYQLPAGTTVIERAYDPQSWQEMSNFFDEYQRVRFYFFKLLGYSDIEGCKQAGLNKEDIHCLREGIAPENYNIHLKIPFDFGGNLDFSNFSLVKTHPLHDLIHKLIDFQIESNFLRVHKKIYIPWFEGKFYND